MQTKGDVVNDAYSRLRISGLTVQPSPEDMVLALQRLEQMMAEFSGRNIIVGYAINTSRTPDSSDQTHVNIEFHNMMASNLACRLIPDFNKDAPPKLLAEASQSLSNASARSAADRVREIPYPDRQPRGNGSSLINTRFQRFYSEDAEAPSNELNNVIRVGDTQDFRETYSAYLNAITPIETISSFVVTVDTGLTLVSSSQSDGVIVYRIHVDPDSTIRGFRQAQIKVTTSAGRIDTRLINFTIIDSRTVGNQDGI